MEYKLSLERGMYSFNRIKNYASLRSSTCTINVVYGWRCGGTCRIHVSCAFKKQMVSSVAMALLNLKSHSVQHEEKYFNYVLTELDIYYIDPITIGYNPHTRDTERISVCSSYFSENCYIRH